MMTRGDEISTTCRGLVSETIYAAQPVVRIQVRTTAQTMLVGCRGACARRLMRGKLFFRCRWTPSNHSDGRQCP